MGSDDDEVEEARTLGLPAYRSTSYNTYFYYAILKVAKTGQRSSGDNTALLLGAAAWHDKAGVGALVWS